MLKPSSAFLLLALVLSGWLPSGCSSPEPPTLYVPFKAEFTLLVMIYPEEGNFDKFEFVTEKYERIYWRPKDEIIICSRTSC
jgi:hypothetical protein